ncbi:MAG: hypothetical protein H3C55_13020 [Pseudorhodoplanes sp.]|nr:hypothetical protein [Pseudorhodoplanes sp.]
MDRVLRCMSLLLFAAGCATIGWIAGLAVYAAAFETLRALDRDAFLDSGAVVRGFELSGAVAAAAAGLMLARRDRSASRLWSGISCGLAGFGGAALAQLLDLGGLAATAFDIGKDAYILVSLSASLALLIAGSLLAARSPGARWIARGMAGGAVALVLVFVSLAGHRALSRPYDNAGEAKWNIWMTVRFPDSVPPAAPGAIGVALRTPSGVTRGFASEWLTENGGLALRINVETRERTRRREVIVTVPDRPPLVFVMPFPSNPRLMHDYGPWHPLDFVMEDDKPKPAARAVDYTIRYMVR